MDTGKVATKPSLAQVTGGSWSLQQDTMLQDARKQGLSWELISKLLPGKSAMDCRTRSEHLLKLRSAREAAYEEKLVRSYHAVRRDMWQVLANATGENDWSALEAKVGEAVPYPSPLRRLGYTSYL